MEKKPDSKDLFTSDRYKMLGRLKFCDIERHSFRHEVHHTSEPCGDCEPSRFVIKRFD